MCKCASRRETKVWVLWFNDYRGSWVDISDIAQFTRENVEKLCSTERSEDLQGAIDEVNNRLHEWIHTESNIERP